jgi:RimJ/RimL family protein N-acetyltransferase
MKKSYLSFLHFFFINLSILVSMSACQGGLWLYPEPVTEAVSQASQIAPAQENLLEQQAASPIDYLAIQQSYIQKYGAPKIKLMATEEGLTVQFTTKNLVIVSVAEKDLLEYTQYLYGSPKVMEKFATGETKDEVYTKARIDGWVKRWRDKNPFAGLTIRTKEGEFIGHVVLGGGDEPNSSEVAYMLKEDKWNQGFGYEAVGASVLFYAAELKKQGYPLPSKELFTRVIATTRKDNAASESIQKKIGMTYYKSSEKFGHHRDHYELSIGLLFLKDSNL